MIQVQVAKKHQKNQKIAYKNTMISDNNVEGRYVVDQCFFICLFSNLLKNPKM